MPRYKLSPEERAAEAERNGNVNICAVEIYPKFSETSLILQPA